MFNYIVEKPESKSSWAWVIGIGMFIGGTFHVVNYFAMPPSAWDCWHVYGELVAFAAVTITFTSLRVSESALDLDNKVIKYAFWSTLGGIVLLGGAALYTWDFFRPQFQRNLFAVKDTVDVVDIIKPIYNFKASGELPWRKDK